MFPFGKIFLAYVLLIRLWLLVAICRLRENLLNKSKWGMETNKKALRKILQSICVNSSFKGNCNKNQGFAIFGNVNHRIVGASAQS